MSSRPGDGLVIIIGNIRALHGKPSALVVNVPDTATRDDLDRARTAFSRSLATGAAFAETHDRNAEGDWEYQAAMPSDADIERWNIRIAANLDRILKPGDSEVVDS
jgi:hypothetical protein